MNILLLGSGGREHAFAWKISQSPRCTKLFIAPGNAGTSFCGTNVSMGVNDFEAIGKFVFENKIEMTKNRDGLHMLPEKIMRSRDRLGTDGHPAG